eukprot:scaffold1981_cov345-Pinguiococcus_pyrenoidosus.AAC.4
MPLQRHKVERPGDADQSAELVWTPRHTAYHRGGYLLSRWRDRFSGPTQLFANASAYSVLGV